MNPLKLVKAWLFTAESSPPHTPREYPLDGVNAWWIDGANLQLCGWTQPRPRKGDFIRCKMTSGRTGRFVFTKVDYCRDPHDMYFGTVKHDGYFDEPPTETARG